jgi:hypothetical protein
MKLHEITDHGAEPLLVSMLRKLAPLIKDRKMDYVVSSFPARRLITRLDIEPTAIELKVMHETGATWAAALPFGVYKDFTIKTYMDHGEKRWLLIKKDLVDQVKDVPEATRG